MSTEHFMVSMLAQSMWHAGFKYTGAFEEQLAELSGHVMRNRVASSAGQLEWPQILTTIDYDAKSEPPRPEDPRFAKLLREAERLYLWQVPDRTQGALYHTVTSRRDHSPCLTLTVGEDVPVYFYKEPCCRETACEDKDRKDSSDLCAYILVQEGVDL